ncbi:MAG: PadR family transcriptional regulator [Longimicrobiales bacterium]
MRLTHPTALVLLALERGHRHGFDVIDATGLKAGTVYPILRRLEDAEMVRSSWEAVTRARAAGRPPRRNYRLTSEGQAAVDEAVSRYPGLGAVLDARQSGALPVTP